MIIKVANTQTANKLTGAMTSGNCIVLYHMHGCPYCVQMMPDWNNFMQLATKQIPGLTIGEVERTHLDKFGDTDVSSFPTIKFYKTGMQNNTMPQNTVQSPKQNSFHNILKGIMGQATAKPVTGDNSVMFEDTRTTDKLIKFAKDNLVNDIKPKGKKAKATVMKTKKAAGQALSKAKKTKKTKPAKGKELVNSLAQLSAVNKNGSVAMNSNMMDLPKYKKAKGTDAKTAKNLKKQILG